MHYFRFKTPIFYIDLSIESKFTFVNGFSGSGKSYFVDVLEQFLGRTTELARHDLIGAELKSDLKVSTMNQLGFMKEPFILVTDEAQAVSAIEYTRDKNIYVVIFSRNVLNIFNCDISQIYVLQQKDNLITTAPKYNIEEVKDYIIPDVIITEDSGNGFAFFSTILAATGIPVISANGKDNIGRAVRKYCNGGNKVQKVLIIADKSGLADSLSQLIISICPKLTDVDLYFLLPQCFESVLLGSPRFNLSEDQISNMYTAKYQSLETFIEILLTKCSKATKYEYRHDNKNNKSCSTDYIKLNNNIETTLSKCWITDCSNCKSECSEIRLNNKIYRTLNNSKVSPILNYIGYMSTQSLCKIQMTTDVIPEEALLPRHNFINEYNLDTSSTSFFTR